MLPILRWLERYAETFDTVDVNATFYRLPTLKAVAGWAHTTPEGFIFAVKASRYLTHVTRLRELREGWRRFHERIAPLVEAEKLGPMTAAATRSASTPRSRQSLCTRAMVAPAQDDSRARGRC